MKIHLLINFMIKRIDRLPLSSIDLGDPQLSPVKPAIKILKQKLPPDFFNKKAAIYSSTTAVRGKQVNLPSTSNFSRKSMKEESPIRKVLTARNNDEGIDQDLIMGVLKSAREIKQVFRRHSVQLNKGFAIKKKTTSFASQLPPLFLKKSITTSL